MNTIGLKFILADRYTFDPNNNSLTDEQNPDEVQLLGNNESRILQFLVQRPDTVVKRNELHDFVWRRQCFEVDDSSLTQAISTLRKNLDDSTKSPQFIRTVPKQGYQWIAEVSSAGTGKKYTPPLAMEAALAEEMQDSEILAHSGVADSAYDNSDNYDSDTMSSPTSDRAVHETDTELATMAMTSSARRSTLLKLFYFLAILIPLTTVFSLNVKETSFKTVTVYDDIRVSLPQTHPDITRWLPTIEKCIDKYNQIHSGEPRPYQVIATGGEENKLILNYVYSEQHIESSTTLILLANQQDLAQVCH